METEKPKRKYRSRKKQNIINDVIKSGDVIGGISEKRVQLKPIQTTGDTVTVCMNFPRDMKFYIPDRNGNKTPIIFNGNATNLKGKDRGIIQPGAYGVTIGVPREAWEWIKTHHKDNALIKKGLLFSPQTKNIRLEVEERSNLKHGFEPVNIDKTTVSKPYVG